METTIEVPETLDLMEGLKKNLIETYSKFGDKKALHLMTGESYSGVEIASAIEKESVLGMKIINNILKLSIDLLARDKANAPNEISKGGLVWLLGHLEHEMGRFSIMTADSREALRDHAAFYFDGQHDAYQQAIKTVKTLIDG